MKYFKSDEIGRVVIVSLEKGDDLIESLTDIVKKEGIQNGVISSGIATFDAVNIRMTNTSGFPIGYITHHLREPLEASSIDGTIINQEVHVHASIGNASHTWSGHLLEGCKILYLGEVVIQEIKGVNLVKMANEHGVLLIEEHEK